MGIEYRNCTIFSTQLKCAMALNKVVYKIPYRRARLAQLRVRARAKVSCIQYVESVAYYKLNIMLSKMYNFKLVFRSSAFYKINSIVARVLGWPGGC